ncbi:MAG: hypothetical protein ACFFD4_31555 [Candidatus Odinarchaeota archaeon]
MAVEKGMERQWKKKGGRLGDRKNVNQSSKQWKNNRVRDGKKNGMEKGMYK